MQEENWTPPNWFYTNKRPPNDNAYFENMCRVIFQAGLNWSVVEKKWPTTQKAFDKFSTEKISRYTDSDVARLMKDEGIVRNKGKISAVIQNAREFEKIKKQHGSFQTYLDSMDKSHNYSSVIKELSARFKWLGPSSANIFLYTVGEKSNTRIDLENSNTPHAQRTGKEGSIEAFPMSLYSFFSFSFFSSPLTPSFIPLPNPLAIPNPFLSPLPTTSPVFSAVSSALPFFFSSSGIHFTSFQNLCNPKTTLVLHLNVKPLPKTTSVRRCLPTAQY